MRNYTLLVTSILSIGVLSLNAEAPKEVRRLEILRDKKVEEIDTIYVGELEKLKLVYMKSGDLESANYVANSIEEIRRKYENQSQDVLELIQGTWKKTKSGQVFVFDGSKGRLGKLDLRLAYDPNTKKITVKSKNFVDTLELTDDPDVITGVGGKLKDHWVLERIK